MAEAKRSLSYYRWPVVIVTFFVVLAIANYHLFVTAVDNFPGLIDETPYESGLKFHETVEKRAALKRKRVRPVITASALDGAHLLTLTLEGAEVSELPRSIDLKLLRPSNVKSDRNVVLEPEQDNPHKFSLKLADLERGLWIIRGNFKLGSREVSFERKEMFP